MIDLKNDGRKLMKKILLTLTISSVLTLSSCTEYKPYQRESSEENSQQTTTEQTTYHEAETTESSFYNQTSNNLYDHISNEEYSKMLDEYNQIFLNEMSIVESNSISDIIRYNGLTNDLSLEISDTLSKLSVSEQTLQSYYDQFNLNRNTAPMQTKIMTMLSYAQTALRQYTIAIEHLQYYLYSPQQSYIDDMQKYAGKASQSLSDYHSVYLSEKAALGETE